MQLTLKEKWANMDSIASIKYSRYFSLRLQVQKCSLRLRAPRHLNLLRLKSSKMTARQTLGCLRDLQRRACTSPQHFGRSRTDRTSVSVLGQKDRTRGTEPRRSLNHTLGVILSRYSMNCRLILNSLPRARRRGIARNCGAAAPFLPLPGGHCGARGCRLPSVSCNGPGCCPSLLRRVGGEQVRAPSLLRRPGRRRRRATARRAVPHGRRAGRSPHRPLPPLRTRERGGRARGGGRENTSGAARTSAAQPRSRPPPLPAGSGAGRTGMAAGTRRKLRSTSSRPAGGGGGRQA